jgi:hypothetical protein
MKKVQAIQEAIDILDRIINDEYIEVAEKELGIDFDEVYARTNTSYKPIFIKDEDLTREAGLQESTPGLGRWYSDYKSAASVERIESFIKLGRRDPVAYADEAGPVKWEVAKAHVEKILADHAEYIIP